MAKREHPVRRLVRKTVELAQKAAGQLEFQLMKFKTEDSEIDLSVDFSSDTVWATQAQMAELFGVDRSVIAKHLQNLFKDNELSEEATCAKFAQVRSEGSREVTREVEHYNLDAILGVGYRVSSAKATKFRQWASNTLKAYIVDGYALNESRLRNDPAALKKLAAKIRELRADEKNVYAAVRDCFKLSAIDYDKESKLTRTFYSTLQNKFVYAITKSTAAQIVLARSSHSKQNMGLMSLKGETPTLAEAKIGKNYLDEDELYALHLLCEQFLLYAESKAIRGQKLTMKELSQKLDALLEMNEYPVFREYKEYLHERAVQHAQAEYALYKKRLKLDGGPKRLK